MGLRLQVEIKESQEELEKAVKYADRGKQQRAITNALLAKEWSGEESQCDRPSLRG